MIEKTEQFQAFQRGFLDELEKVADTQGLTDLEKVAVLGRVGTALGNWARLGGHELLKGGVPKGMRRSAGHGLTSIADLIHDNPQIAGALGIGVPAAGAVGAAGLALHNK